MASKKLASLVIALVSAMSLQALAQGAGGGGGAFELWEDAGRPDGEMDRFWYAAKEELLLQRGDGLLINYREMTHLIS